MVAHDSSAGRSRPVRRLQQVRIAESVAAVLRARILVSREGAALPSQAELVAEFQVSYPSVREALRILETEGLISVRRGNVGGAEILRPDATSAAYSMGLALQAARVRIADLGDAWVRLEPQCAAMCAAGEDAATVGSRLRANLDEARRSLGDHQQFTACAREFHEIIVSFAGNHTIGLMVRSLVELWSSQEETWDELMALTGEGYVPADRQRGLDEHSLIAACIESGDVAGAEEAARRHITAIRDLYISRFGGLDVVDASLMRVRRSLEPLR